MGRINEIIIEEIERLRNIQAGQWSNDIFSSLLSVGENKPVGYLSLSTIDKYGDDNALHDLIQWASDKKYGVEIFKNGTTASGALYIWDNKSLNQLLTKYSQILKKAKIPTTADEYVKYIEHNIVSDDVYPDAYAVVGKSFNDKRYRDEIPISEDYPLPDDASTSPLPQYGDRLPSIS